MSVVLHLCKYKGWYRNNLWNGNNHFEYLCGLGEFDSPYGHDHVFPESRENPFSFSYDNRTHDNDAAEFNVEEPTCETCILVHWSNPENTEYSRD